LPNGKLLREELFRVSRLCEAEELLQGYLGQTEPVAA
jgi:hypothetical protein